MQIRDLAQDAGSSSLYPQGKSGSMKEVRPFRPEKGLYLSILDY